MYFKVVKIMPDGFILVILQSDYCFDMYNDKHIVKCRPFPHIADNVCSGDAPSLAEALFVCPAFSKISNRKCADYLAVWKIRVNTHTHTHNRYARQDTNYLLNINQLAKRFFVSFATIPFQKHLIHHIPPLPSAARGIIVPDGDIRST